MSKEINRVWLSGKYEPSSTGFGHGPYVYIVHLDDEEVFRTEDTYKRDMFVAELKAKIKLLPEPPRE